MIVEIQGKFIDTNMVVAVSTVDFQYPQRGPDLVYFDIITVGNGVIKIETDITNRNGPTFTDMQIQEMHDAHQRFMRIWTMHKPNIISITL